MWFKPAVGLLALCAASSQAQLLVMTRPMQHHHASPTPSSATTTTTKAVVDSKGRALISTIINGHGSMVVPTVQHSASSKPTQNSGTDDAAPVPTAAATLARRDGGGNRGGLLGMDALLDLADVMGGGENLRDSWYRTWNPEMHRWHSDYDEASREKNAEIAAAIEEKKRQETLKAEGEQAKAVEAQKHEEFWAPAKGENDLFKPAKEGLAERSMEFRVPAEVVEMVERSRLPVEDTVEEDSCSTEISPKSQPPKEFPSHVEVARKQHHHAKDMPAPCTRPTRRDSRAKQIRRQLVGAEPTNTLAKSIKGFFNGTKKVKREDGKKQPCFRRGNSMDCVDADEMCFRRGGAMHCVDLEAMRAEKEQKEQGLAR
ncbi:hypothetical protein MBLNU230_g8344t1 [Neophaeotheca triangularis]